MSQHSHAFHEHSDGADEARVASAPSGSGPSPLDGLTDCSEVLLRVYEYIDDEMPEVDGARIKEHLDSCSNCLTEYERDRLLKAIVRRSCECEEAPSTLRLQIMAQITTVTIRTQS